MSGFYFLFFILNQFKAQCCWKLQSKAAFLVSVSHSSPDSRIERFPHLKNVVLWVYTPSEQASHLGVLLFPPPLHVYNHIPW